MRYFCFERNIEDRIFLSSHSMDTIGDGLFGNIVGISIDRDRVIDVLEDQLSNIDPEFINNL